MKKILTLMATASVVTGAFANDFDWQNIPANPKTDASNNVTEKGYEGLSFFKDKNTLSFDVNAGDNVVLTVNGKNLKVSVGGTELVTKLENGKITFDVTKDGTVSLAMGEGTAVTAIYVESDNYRKALEIIKSGKASVTDALQKISNYSTETDKDTKYNKSDERSFSGLFNSAAGLINTEAQKIAQLEADLKGYKADNTVGDYLAAMKSVENAVANNIDDIVAKAQKAHDDYMKVAFTDTKSLTDRIDEAESKKEIKNTTKNYINALNKKTTYIYDYKYASNKGTVDKLKADWCQTVLNDIKGDLKSFRDGAMEYYSDLSGNHDDAGFGASADIVTGLKADIDNMIARAIVERDYSTKIADLSNSVKALEKVMETKDAEGKEVFTKPAGYDAWVTSIKTISELIAKTDNRRDYTEADLKSMVTDVCGTAEATFTQFQTALAEQAETALNKLVAVAQGDIDTYSYKIAAKYENEPATQKEYQEKFAALQATLNGYKKTIKDKQYNDVVLGYNDLAAKIKEISTKILGPDGLWTSTLSAQKTEVINNNAAAAKALTDKIDEIRANYNKKIESIAKWKEADFAKSHGGNLVDNGDLVTYLQARQSILFDIVNDLDKEKVEINAAVAALAEKISAVDDVEFDPTDNKYRFTDENVNKYEKATADLDVKINEQLELAATAANDRAYYYFENDSQIGSTMTKWSTVRIYDNKKLDLDEGRNNSKMSPAAYTKFDNRYAGIIWANKYVNDKNEDKGEKYLDLALAKAAEYYADKNMADSIGVLTTEYLSKIQPTVDAVNKEYEAYTKLYGKVLEKKVKYTEAKAKESTYVAEYMKAAGVDETAAKNFINGKLNDINKLIADFSDKLEDKALEATTLKTEGEAAFDAFEDGYFQITDYAAYKANNEAKVEADKQVALVEAEITNLKAQIADYREDAKAIGETAIANAETQLEAQKSSIEKDFNDGKLGTTYPNSIKGVLESIIANLKAAAEEAKKAQEGGNLDVNGDGEVNSADVKVKKNEAQQSGNVKDFMDFLSRYLEIIAK